MSHCGIPRDQAENLFLFMVYGLFYCNRAMRWKKDDIWYDMQYVINQFITGGLDAVQNGKNS